MIAAPLPISPVEGLWLRQAELLRSAFLSGSGNLSTAVLTLALTSELGPKPICVLDVGGGTGSLSISLAKLGHSVCLVDCDPVMLAHARSRLAAEEAAIRDRVTFRIGDAAHLRRLDLREHDLTCCHSVICYEPDLRRIVNELVEATRIGGLVSILSTDPYSSAMRPGLQGKFATALELLYGKPTEFDWHVKMVDHPRSAVEDALTASGCEPVSWQGVGIFTDHLEGPIRLDEANVGALIEAELIAGFRDPYRSIARCYHLMARRRA